MERARANPRMARTDITLLLPTHGPQRAASHEYKSGRNTPQERGPRPCRPASVRTGSATFRLVRLWPGARTLQIWPHMAACKGRAAAVAPAPRGGRSYWKHPTRKHCGHGRTAPALAAKAATRYKSGHAHVFHLVSLLAVAVKHPFPGGGGRCGPARHPDPDPAGRAARQRPSLRLRGRAHGPAGLPPGPPGHRLHAGRAPGPAGATARPGRAYGPLPLAPGHAARHHCRAGLAGGHGLPVFLSEGRRRSPPARPAAGGPASRQGQKNRPGPGPEPMGRTGISQPPVSGSGGADLLFYRPDPAALALCRAAARYGTEHGGSGRVFHIPPRPVRRSGPGGRGGPAGSDPAAQGAGRHAP